MKKKVEFPTKLKIEFQMLDHMSQHRARHVYPQHMDFENSAKRCHHCGRCSHIIPFCYKLYGYPWYYSQPKSKRNKGKKPQAKKVGKLKENVKCLLAYVPL